MQTVGLAALQRDHLYTVDPTDGESCCRDYSSAVGRPGLRCGGNRARRTDSARPVPMPSTGLPGPTERRVWMSKKNF